MVKISFVLVRFQRRRRQQFLHLQQTEKWNLVRHHRLVLAPSMQLRHQCVCVCVVGGWTNPAHRSRGHSS